MVANDAIEADEVRVIRSIASSEGRALAIADRQDLADAATGLLDLQNGSGRRVDSSRVGARTTRPAHPDLILVGTDADLALVVSRLSHARTLAVRGRADLPAVEHDAIAIGLVPAPGSDLGATFGAPRRMATSLERMRVPQPAHRCEIWQVTDKSGESRPMVNAAALGVAAAWQGGMLGRIRAVITRPREVHLKMGHIAWDGRVTSILVGSGQFFCGRELLARALPGDGRLEVLLQTSWGWSFPTIWQQSRAGLHVERGDLLRRTPTCIEVGGGAWVGLIDGVSARLDSPSFEDSGLRFSLIV